MVCTWSPHRRHGSSFKPMDGWESMTRFGICPLHPPQQNQQNLGGGLKMFEIFVIIFITICGNDPIWRAYFQMGWNHKLEMMTPNPKGLRTQHHITTLPLSCLEMFSDMLKQQTCWGLLKICWSFFGQNLGKGTCWRSFSRDLKMQYLPTSKQTLRNTLHP